MLKLYIPVVRLYRRDEFPGFIRHSETCKKVYVDDLINVRCIL